MKWFFCLNSSARDKFSEMIFIALESCRDNTSLLPNCIYDGEPDYFTDQLKLLGVQVYFKKVRFFDELVKMDGVNGLKLEIARGAFLRTVIPDLDIDDDYVLYTDADVIFVKDPVPHLSKIRPRYIGATCESILGSKSFFNSGVMLLNVKNMRSISDDFNNFIQCNLTKFQSFSPNDQGAYNYFFRGLTDWIPEAFNVKPYWFFESDVYIYHFHGSRPIEASEFLFNISEGKESVVPTRFDGKESALLNSVGYYNNLRIKYGFLKYKIVLSFVSVRFIRIQIFAENPPESDYFQLILNGAYLKILKLIFSKKYFGGEHIGYVYLVPIPINVLTGTEFLNFQLNVLGGATVAELVVPGINLENLSVEGDVHGFYTRHDNVCYEILSDSYSEVQFSNSSENVFWLNPLQHNLFNGIKFKTSNHYFCSATDVLIFVSSIDFLLLDKYRRHYSFGFDRDIIKLQPFLVEGLDQDFDYYPFSTVGNKYWFFDLCMLCVFAFNDINRSKFLVRSDDFLIISNYLRIFHFPLNCLVVVDDGCYSAHRVFYLRKDTDFFSSSSLKIFRDFLNSNLFIPNFVQNQVLVFESDVVYEVDNCPEFVKKVQWSDEISDLIQNCCSYKFVVIKDELQLKIFPFLPSSTHIINFSIAPSAFVQEACQLFGFEYSFIEDVNDDGNLYDFLDLIRAHSLGLLS